MIAMALALASIGLFGAHFSDLYFNRATRPVTEATNGRGRSWLKSGAR